MEDKKFQQLILRAEGETLDFKEDGYDLSSKKSRNNFIKDVLAMANTPRDNTAHIVFGVRWTPESGSSVVGLNRQLDDVKLQDAFGKDRVLPRPRFTYTPFTFNERPVGVLEIPVGNDGPYTAIKDYEGLRAGVVYYRRGTQNYIASGSELNRIIAWWHDRACTSVPDEQWRDAWPRFLEAVHNFEKGRTFLLAVDRISAKAEAPVSTLGMLPWRAVIDFDPDSDDNGLLSCISDTLERHRVVHRVVREEYRVQPEPGTHWFFARGLSGRANTVCIDNHSIWLRKYKQELAQQLVHLASAINPSPVLALILWSDDDLYRHLRTLIEELYGAFGEGVEVVVVSSDAPSFQSHVEDLGATFIRLGLRSLCHGIASIVGDCQYTNDEHYSIPDSSGVPIRIETKEWLWLSEDLELVHLRAGLDGDDDATDFRRGAEVTWRNLHLHHDCDREILQRLRAQVKRDLLGRQTVRINLYHEPGGGGTNVARRVAWDLHTDWPVGILKRCISNETAERIGKVAALTESSVLLLADGGQHSERSIDELYEFLKANQTPVVLLQVLRRFSRPQRIGSRLFWLPAQLSDIEADRFRSAYSQVEPSKSHELNELAQRRGDPLRNAFFFGITAFGSEFRGLDTYVRRRIEGLTEQQQRILVYIAMAYYYGQQPVPVQAFAHLLGLPQSRRVDLATAFAGRAIGALDLIVEARPGEYRVAHHLIALEIMQQAIAPKNSQDHKSVWRQNLSSWAKDFVNFCRGDTPTVSDRLLELVRRVFVYRYNVEVLGTERSAQRRFAQLVEDIPSQEGKIEVLRHLTHLFPSEAHFHAHLGRFLSLNGDHIEALNCLDEALRLQPNDHVLHHMRGMALRQKMQAHIERGASTDQLIKIAREASESFDKARQLRPDEEHGYISEVQMLIKLIDSVSQSYEDPIHDVLARPQTDPFLKQALEKAEDLLDQVQHLYAGEKVSKYALDCRARLQRIYNNYETALQAWDSLLSRPEVAKPPVRRQIVWTLLRRRADSWDNLTPREIERIIRLLKENLQEEVDDSTSLRLWLRAIRYSSMPPSLESVIERVSYWKTNTGSLDATYYLYVLHMLRALAGSTQGAADAELALEECRALARFRRDRTRSFEWIGSGDGVARLVHQSQLGDWEGDFWSSTEALVRLNGRIISIERPQRGFVEIKDGLRAFFVPAKAGFYTGRDENTPITCYIGFSYDGPRAWNIKRRET